MNKYGQLCHLGSPAACLHSKSFKKTEIKHRHQKQGHGPQGVAGGKSTRVSPRIEIINVIYLFCFIFLLALIFLFLSLHENHICIIFLVLALNFLIANI